MSGQTRRDFLTTAGTGLAAGLLLKTNVRAQRGAPALRVRKNFASPSAAGDVASLKKGVDAMRKLVTTKPSDPRGWVMQAFIHGDCNQFTKCQHGNWFFPPWHRSFLYYFEQLIQYYSNDPGFALPYWDWSRTHSIPASWYGTGNPLDDILSIASKCPGAPTAGRGRTAAQSFSQGDLNTYVGPTVISNMQQNPDYTTWGGGNPGTGELEGRPHNFIHRWVGGTKFSNMVQTFSPLDPIFWMHHCNIDRLYSNWLQRPNHFPPSDAAWKNKSFNDFFDKDGNPAGSAFKAGDTVDSKVMGYVYQAVGLTGPSSTQPPAAPPAQQVVGTLTASTPKKQGGVLTYVTDTPPSTDVRGPMNAAALGATNVVVRLRIEGVKVPPRQNTAVHVFLGPDVKANTPTTAAGYAGSFTFFDGRDAGAGAAAAGHQHTRDILINASGALSRLYGDVSLPENESVVVSIVTQPLYTGVTAYSTIEQIQPDRVRLEVVRFGG